MYYARFIIINHVSKHQFSHAVNASHTTPITRVNLCPMLLKLKVGYIVYVLSGYRTYRNHGSDSWY